MLSRCFHLFFFVVESFEMNSSVTKSQWVMTKWNKNQNELRKVPFHFKQFRSIYPSIRGQKKRRRYNDWLPVKMFPFIALTFRWINLYERTFHLIFFFFKYKWTWQECSLVKSPWIFNRFYSYTLNVQKVHFDIDERTNKWNFICHPHALAQSTDCTFYFLQNISTNKDSSYVFPSSIFDPFSWNNKLLARTFQVNEQKNYFTFQFFCAKIINVHGKCIERKAKFDKRKTSAKRE